jgi:DNA-binding transcriptional LysR family regulator
MEWTSTSLRVLRGVAEHGSFSTAAVALGYTQSSVSRQVAALERAAGVRLFDRSSKGVRITGAGRTLLRHASNALDEVDQAARTVHNTGAARAVVRVGLFPSAGAAFVPPLVASLRQDCPGITVTIREGSTPSLLRSVRASSLDLAVIGSQPSHAPLGDEARAVVLEALVEGEVVVAVPSRSSIGPDGTVTVAQLQECVWITSSSSSREPGFGAWPALLNRPAATYHARDWLTKLTLVAHGLGVTTVPPYLGASSPTGSAWSGSSTVRP